ncbi:Uncharacterized protein SCF082_LOCUS51984, partial [Durusdinium trenchii]
DVTPKRGAQNEAAELRGISSPPRLNGATSDAVHLLPEATVEDQVLSGLTWEEIAGIPDEEMRKRAVSLKQRGSSEASRPSEARRKPTRSEDPELGQALFEYLEARQLGSSHTAAVEAASSGGALGTPEVPTQPSVGNYGLTRPTPQSLFRPNPAGENHGGRTDAVDALAHATRAFRAGAYTDAEAPAADETTKALQAIAKSLTSKEDALAQDRGKLASIGRLEERIVFLLRGCDTLSVTLCPGVVGKELFHALRIAGTQARPQLRRIEFPCNIQNRHSYGFAAVQIGGKSPNTIPEYCLSAGDFPLTSEEDFDNYGGTPDLKLEKKGRYPNTLTSWFRAALRQSWAFACLFGEEYYPVLEKADETPTFARLKVFALSPGPDGQPWLQLPGTFRLDDETQYFCTDMLPRMQRQLSRACWAGAQKRGAGGGGRAAGGGEQAEARTEPGDAPAPPRGGRAGSDAAGGAGPPKLLGPGLTPKEASRSLDHRPKDQQGQYLCWDYLGHRGCNKGSACPHSHKAIPKWTSLDYTVQLQLLRRGGLRNSKAKTSEEVEREFTRIRAEQAAKAAASKQEGIAAAKAKASTTQKAGQAQTGTGNGTAEGASRAGERTHEDALTERWWQDVDANAATLTRSSASFEDTERAAHMREVDAAEQNLGPYPSGLVGVYLRNRLLRQREETNQAPGLDDVTQLLEEAVALGGPELAEEAARLLEARGLHRKAGESPVVQLSPVTWNSSIGAGTLTWNGVGQWAMFDYQDQLQIPPDFCDRLGFATAETEPKQCLLLHVAAAYLSAPGAPLPGAEAVQELAVEWRERWSCQARVVEDSLGPVPSRITQAEADVRVFHHDLLHFGHDRDYRTLVAHPLDEWAELGLAVLRVDAYMRPSVEVICGSGYNGLAEHTRWVLIHRGHMRLLRPDQPCVPPLGSREIEAAGWEAYLEGAEGSPLLEASRLLQCQVCHPKRSLGSFRTGREAGAFGLQVLRAGRGVSTEARFGAGALPPAPPAVACSRPGALSE